MTQPLTPTDVDTVSWLRVALSFAIVSALLGGLAYGLKFLGQRGFGSFSSPAQKTKRLTLVESIPLDIKRRAVILRCDSQEYLLLLGGERETVITPLPPPSAEKPIS